MWCQVVQTVQFPANFRNRLFSPNCDEMSPSLIRWSSFVFPILNSFPVQLRRKFLNTFSFIDVASNRRRVSIVIYFSSFQAVRELLFWNSRRENGDAEKANHFLTMQRHVLITSVAWISANQIAIGLWNNEIEIWEINEDEGTNRVVKRFRHSKQVSRNEGSRTWNIWWRISILFWWRITG